MAKNRKTNLASIKEPSTDKTAANTLSENENKPDDISSSLSDIFVFVALTVGCLVLYSQVIQFQFINLDDNLYVYENPVVARGLSWQGIVWAFTAFHASNWHPLTWISHMMDVSLFGLNAGYHHAINVIFHLINSFLAFSVFHRLTRAYWASAVVAFLFAFHPVHVESVAWVSERKDVLSTLFWLLAMWAYIRYAEDAKSNVKYGFVILFFALGLLSKPMVVTLPFVLLLLDYWSLDRLKEKKDILPLVREKLPLFLLIVGSAVLTIIAQKSSGAVSSLEHITFATRMINAVFSYTKYVLMLFYPVNLGILYPYSSDFNFWQLIMAILFLLAVTVFCLWQAKKRKYLLFGWLWFLGTLVPVIGIVQVGSQSLADRYTYIPYFGLFIMLIWGSAEIIEKFKINKTAVIALCSIVLIVLSGLTYKQVSYWKTAETIYKHTLSITKNNILITNNYCLNLISANRIEEAEQNCTLLADGHRFSNGYLAWGVILLRRGKDEEAQKQFEKAVMLDANDPLGYSNLSVALIKQGKLDEAFGNLQKAEEVNKGKLPLSELGNNYGLIALNYIQQKQYEKAIPFFVKALQLAPMRADIRANYGAALSLQGHQDEAKKQLEESIRQNPNQPEAYNSLGLVFLAQGKREEAITQFEKALQIKPDLASAKESLEKLKETK